MALGTVRFAAGARSSMTERFLRPLMRLRTRESAHGYMGKTTRLAARLANRHKNDASPVSASPADDSLWTGIYPDPICLADFSSDGRASSVALASSVGSSRRSRRLGARRIEMLRRADQEPIAGNCWRGPDHLGHFIRCHYLKVWTGLNYKDATTLV